MEKKIEVRVASILLGALALSVAIIMVFAPPGEAQIAPEPPTIDKECRPNPVQVGQQLTCTINVVAAPDTIATVSVTDAFPEGVKVTKATFQIFLNGNLVQGGPCIVASNTVTCGLEGGSFAVQDFQGNIQTLRVTIDAIAEECRVFTNTASAEGVVSVITVSPRGFPVIGPLVPFSNFTDAEEIPVTGCEVPLAPRQQPAAPITQDSKQESEAGEINQTFDVS